MTKVKKDTTWTRISEISLISQKQKVYQVKNVKFRARFVECIISEKDDYDKWSDRKYIFTYENIEWMRSLYA